MARILCCGIAVRDHIFYTETLPSGSGKNFADQYHSSVGGPAGMAAVTAAALGHEVIFAGRLGDDSVGAGVREQMEALGVDMTHVRMVPGAQSVAASVVVDAQGERQCVACSGRGLESDPSFLDDSLLDAVDAVLCDARWPEGAEKVLAAAGRRGLPSVLDADLTPFAIDRLVTLASHPVFSEPGLAAYAGNCSGEGAGPDSLLRAAAGDAGPGAVVTLGERGCLYVEGGGAKSLPAFRVPVEDTTGAGDVFHGAFAVALAEKMPIRLALTYASAASAVKCARRGGTAGVPKIEDVETILRQADRD